MTLNERLQLKGKLLLLLLLRRPEDMITPRRGGKFNNRPPFGHNGRHTSATGTQYGLRQERPGFRKGGGAGKACERKTGNCGQSDRTPLEGRERVSARSTFLPAARTAGRVDWIFLIQGLNQIK